MTPEGYRSALPRLYAALVARHGRPTQIQLESAEPILGGRDTLLCAPTASGKTEAWMAPIGERHLGTRVGHGALAPTGHGDDVPRVLVVSPTRALVNDLHRRLAPRLDAAGIALGRWTGDQHDGGQMHTITILTPEGLDSRLSRGADLQAVTAVVIDEIHVLDGTARGDQLRILLQRLRARREPVTSSGPPGHPLQVVAASATVASPLALAERYLHDPVVVSVGETRPVRGRIERSVEAADILRCLGDAVSAGFRKVLFFANSRNNVEELAFALRGHAPFGDSVFAHHGSLSRSARLGVEERFLALPTALCVATSTLEMGIDIGDVDLVAMKGLPSSAASLLQRVGRGGRRREASSLLAFVETAFEETALRTLLAAGKRGEWHEAPYAFRPGVLVQQAVSVLHERPSRTVDGASLHRRLPPALAAEWPAERIAGVLAGAETKGWLSRPAAVNDPRPRWGIGPKAEALWARGALHANLSQQTDVAVFDSLTGDEVGRVASADGAHLGLGGRQRRVFHASGERIVTEGARSDGAATFTPLPPAAIPGALAQALLAAIGIPEATRCELPGRVLFHGLGTAGGAVLAGCWPSGLLSHAGPLAIAFRGDWPPWPGPDAARSAVARLHRSIGRTLGMGAYHGVLPEDERVAAVASLCELDRVDRLLRAGMPEIVAAGGREDLWREAGEW
ncbi:MAG: DEAD/DEAH box helicase [Myxococcales bacterium]|nr:DEAD/DEAH box helicase [Myxococcales bacterium]